MAILQNKFVREDGSIIGSSVIISCKYTSDVNSQTNLTVGDTTAAEVDVEIRNPTKEIVAGEKLTYYQIEDGAENLIGVFYTEAPTSYTKTSVRFSAYDGMAKLAVDFSEWLGQNQDKFPMTLGELAGYACSVAGLALSSAHFNFKSLEVPAFNADGITARSVIGWIGQIAGCFASCNASGEVFYDWYRKTDISITGAQFRQDSLAKKTYTTEEIKRVQFKGSTDDVGIIYPADADGNVFVIAYNRIASQMSSATLEAIAASLYGKLRKIVYTPLSLKLGRTTSIKAGDIISVTDANGKAVTTYIMKVVTDSSGTTISSTGDQNYAGKAAVSSEKYSNLDGKRFEITKSIEGLTIEAEAAQDRMTKLELEAGQVNLTVEKGIAPYAFRINAAGELIYSTQDTSTMFSINDDGELVCTYEGDTPELHIDEDGYLILTTETSDTAVLRTVINAEGEWESVYSVNGEEQSSIRFDFAAGRFVFNGTVEATAGDIGGCQIEDGTLVVGSWRTGNLKITNATETETYYDGTAIFSQTQYDAVERSELGVALTHEKVYIYGRDSMGAAVVDYASWEDIIRAANNS